MKRLRCLSACVWLLVVIRTAWQWCGARVALRFFIGLSRLLRSRLALSVVYDTIGPVVFRRKFCGKVITWASVDFGYVWEIFDQQCYTGVAGMNIAERDTVVDVGANVGVFTVFAAVCAPHGRVIALEPKRSNFLKLRSNVEVNQLQNVTVVNAALADYDGEATLWNRGYGAGSSSLIRSDSRSGETVQVFTPFTFMLRYDLAHVDFLKLDVEGAEYAFFSGDLSWLRKVRRVSLEAHVAFGEPWSIVEALERAGFRVMLESGKLPYGDDVQIYAART